MSTFSQNVRKFYNLDRIKGLEKANREQIGKHVYCIPPSELQRQIKEKYLVPKIQICVQVGSKILIKVNQNVTLSKLKFFI